jgi:acetyl-CoA carboxylase biotin carboxyl carrier protein
MDATRLVPQLAAWLAGSDLVMLELHGPGIRVRLLRDEAGTVAPHVTTAALKTSVMPAPSVVPAPTFVRATTVGRATNFVRSPAVGILRYCHPQTGLPIAPQGTHVRAGQAVALLQIGPLLLPVPAVDAGVIGAPLAAEGSAIGYGDPVAQLLTTG